MSNYSFRYQLYSPGGNDTALVFGLVADPNLRHQINDHIMARHPQIEQVGFINPDLQLPELVMAGGEFCGNATRSAAWNFLAGQPGQIQLKVSGTDQLLKAGVDEQGEAWAQMPVPSSLSQSIRELASGYFLAQLDGITHLIIPDASQIDPTSREEQAISLLREYQLFDLPAAGVLYLEPAVTGLKMHPYVRVSAINSMFYETACGSGTTAIGLMTAFKTQQPVKLDVAQPSGQKITIIIELAGDQLTQAQISGPIQADPVIYREEVEEIGSDISANH